MAVKQFLSPWPGQMSGRERFNRQMHYQRVDRSFNMEFGYWKENFQEWSLFREHNICNNQEADIFFAFDRIETVAGKVWLHPLFETKILEHRGETNLVITQEGLLAEVPVDGHSSIAQFLGPSIVTPDDWKRSKEERFCRNHPDRIVDLEALRKQHPEDRDYPLGVYCGSMIGCIRNLLTFEGLTYATYDYPEMVEDMVETACLLTEDFLDQVLPILTFDFASGWEDICFNSGPLVTMDFMRNVVLPRYKRIQKKLAANGIDLWFTDCDGDVRPILPIFLEGGINCLFPYEVMSCTHPGELLDQYQGQLRIMGGVDKIQLAKGPEAIKNYLESIAPYVEKGGYIPFCDHRCPPDVKQEYYLYYLDLKRQMFGGGQ